MPSDSHVPIKQLEWVKLSRDTIGAVIESGQSDAFLRLIRRSMRLKAPVSTNHQDFAELIMDEFIFESEEGLIPACVVDAIESTDKTSQSRVNGWRTRRKSLKKDQADIVIIQSDIKSPVVDVALMIEEKREEQREQRERIYPPLGKPGGEIGYSSDFLKFWEIYPAKTGKGQAWESWKKRKAPIPEISQVLKSVEDNKASFKWRKDGGQFVPMPSTWINQRRWEDEAGSTQDTSRPNRFIDDTPPQGLKTGNYNGETF